MKNVLIIIITCIEVVFRTLPDIKKEVLMKIVKYNRKLLTVFGNSSILQCLNWPLCHNNLEFLLLDSII